MSKYINLGKLLERGQEALDDKRSEESKTKLGNLRGGSAGAIVGGEVYGHCHRLHMLRTKGIEIDPEGTTQVMFDSGIANEESVAKVLNESVPKGLRLLREDEFPVLWTEPTFTVSGRPDFVYVDANNQPQLGLELKSVSSIHTARNVIAENKPSSGNLVQAAFYSWRLGAQNGTGPIPYKLVYTSSPYWHINYNKHLEGAFQDNPLVEHKKDRPFRVKPCRVVYDLTWQNGVLCYEREDGFSPLVKTLLTTESIELYYRKVSEMAQSKVLGPRPSNKSVSGQKSYSPCDYCDLASVCDEKESNFDTWLDAVILHVRSINKERS